MKTPDLIEMSRNGLIWLVVNKSAFIRACGIIGVILLADSVYRGTKIISQARKG
jgi:hypothetical protein